MASLTDATEPTLSSDLRELRAFQIADAEVVYQGGYYGVNAAGYLTEMADTVALAPVGTINHFGMGCADAAGALPLSVTGDTSATPPPQAVVDIGGKILEGVPVAGASTIADLMDHVYLGTDNLLADLTITPTTNTPPIGEIIKFHSATSFDVQLYSHAVMWGQP